MKLWWYSAGNILYALGSLGYLAINLANLINRQTVESQATYIVLIILAIVFIIDALLYTADWYEQRAIKERRELIGCILNIIGSVLYLIGATVFVNQQSSTNNFNNTTNIPAFVFNIAGMLAYLGESILDFFAPRVSKTTSKCSVEFFAHLLNLLGNISYLCAHIIQPIVSTIASFTTDSLNTIMNFIFIIIRPIQIGGDVIYTIDAVLYIIVWIKANEQMRKVGVAWLEKGNTTFNQIMKKKKAATTIENLPVVEDISKQTPEPIPPDVETIT
jgi:hypothetical protein